MKQQSDQMVQEAFAQFYIALNQMFTGDLTAMKDVWSHADDVTYIGPDGTVQVVYDKVLKAFEKQAAMKLGGSVKPSNIHVIIGKDLAIMQNFEEGKNLKANGKTQVISIRVTNVFRLENGKWKMVSHHTDRLPWME